VSEYGTHEELMARNGDYARLFSLQALAYVDNSQAVGNGSAGPPSQPKTARMR
jgi:hypothetical protein